MAKTAGITSKRELITKAKSSQFIVVIVASVVVSASLIGIKILWEQRTYQSKIISAKTEARDRLEENIKAVESLKEDFNKLEASEINSSLVLDALPSRYDFPALATSIEKIAKTSGVELDSFVGDDKTASASNTAGQPTPQEIQFSVSVKGPYDNVKKFIDALHRSIRPFRIDEIGLDSSGNDINVNMKLVTFYVPAKSIEIQKESISSKPASKDKKAKTNDAATTNDLPAGVDATGVPQ